MEALAAVSLAGNILQFLDFVGTGGLQDTQDLHLRHQYTKRA